MNSLKDLFFGKTWKGSIFRVLLILTIATIPFWYHYRILYVDGISMSPTYDDGQWTLMQRVRSFDSGWMPDRFDTIVVWDKNREIQLCKRVIGLPGEKVEVIEGRIFIDGVELSDSFGTGYMVFRKLVYPDTGEVWWKDYDNVSSVSIAPGHVWVIGDNREDSIFGHFPIKDIRGKIVLY